MSSPMNYGPDSPHGGLMDTGPAKTAAPAPAVTTAGTAAGAAGNAVGGVAGAAGNAVGMAASLDRTGIAPATLLALSGPARGSRIEVPAGGLLFGRAAGSAGQLGDDPALSRWHARLDLAGEGLVVEDLASTNGTLLNGQRTSGRQPVRPGDVVTIGASQLQALPPPATPPAQLRTHATALLPALAAPPAPAASPAAAPHPAAPAPADLWGCINGLRQQVDALRQDLAAAGELSRQGLAAAEERIRELENGLRDMRARAGRP